MGKGYTPRSQRKVSQCWCQFHGCHSVVFHVKINVPIFSLTKQYIYCSLAPCFGLYLDCHQATVLIWAFKNIGKSVDKNTHFVYKISQLQGINYSYPTDIFIITVLCSGTKIKLLNQNVLQKIFQCTDVHLFLSVFWSC